MNVRMGIKTGKWKTGARWVRQKMMRGADFYKINISVQKLYATVSSHLCISPSLQRTFSGAYFITGIYLSK